MIVRHALSFLVGMSSLLYSQTISLRGRVLEKASLFPVAGATVKLAGTNHAALTDSNGRFTITETSTLNIKTGLNTPLASPMLQGSDLLVAANQKNQKVVVEFFGLLGQSISSSTYTLNQDGINRIHISNWPEQNFLGFIKVTSAGVTSVLRALSLPQLGSKTATTKTTTFSGASSSSSNPKALSKSAAGGTVEVTMDKLIPKSVQATSDVADLGDIVLDYPARTKIGVGATMPYGAQMFFDGSNGKVAAKAELDTKWEDWLPLGTGNNLYTAALHQFKIAKDPEFENDPNRATLMSCCDKNWGYDDIRTIKTQGDAQIHVEFNLMGQYDSTENPNANDDFRESGPGAGYANSGVYIQSRYEVQIYSITQDSAYKPTSHEMGALVDDYAPDKNVNKPNGVWQSYDITFRQARYDSTGKSKEDGYVSIWWNGVLVHDNRQAHAKATGLNAHSGEELNPTEYGLKLQSEGRDVRFRNIWIKPLLITTPQTKFGY